MREGKGCEVSKEEPEESREAVKEMMKRRRYKEWEKGGLKGRKGEMEVKSRNRRL